MNKDKVLLAMVAMTALVQSAGAQGRFDDVQVESEKVAPDLYMLTGAGGNLALVTGEGAPFIVDDQYAEMAEKIRAQIATLTDKPVGFVVNTHWHGDHSGGNEIFAKNDAVIVAHENVRTRMSTEQFSTMWNSTTPPSPAAALPVVTFANDMTLHLNGKTMRLQHIANAHTDGDSVVWFAEDNVLHTGDLFFNGMYPYIDIDAGGSIRGMIAAATKMLAATNDETRIIPGHGPLARRNDLRGYRDFLATVADAIEALIAEGKSVDEVVTAKPTADFDATINRHGFFKPEQWVKLIYADLSR